MSNTVISNNFNDWGELIWKKGEKQFAKSEAYTEYHTEGQESKQEGKGEAITPSPGVLWMI